MVFPLEAPTLGVIGGMGPLATVAFLRALTLETAADRDQDHLHVLVDSDPTIPDRTAFLLGAGPDPRPALIRAARRLEQAGATFLVMPCNTATVFAGDIARAVCVPLLPWIGIAAAAAGSGQRVGLLATDGTLAAGKYQAAINAHGSSVVLSAPDDQLIVTDVVYGPRGVKATGGVTPEGRAGLLAVAARLAAAGADCLLLACTELPLAIPADDPAWPVPAIDPAVEVARHAIQLAGRAVRGQVLT